MAESYHFALFLLLLNQFRGLDDDQALLKGWWKAAVLQSGALRRYRSPHSPSVPGTRYAGFPDVANPRAQTRSQRPNWEGTGENSGIIHKWSRDN